MLSLSALLVLVLAVASTASGEEHFCESAAQADVLLQKDAVRTPSNGQLSAPRELSEYALDRGVLNAMVIKAVAKEVPPERMASDAARAPKQPRVVMAMRGSSVNAPHGADEAPTETSHGTDGEQETAQAPEESTKSREAVETSMKAEAPSKLLSTALRAELNIQSALGEIHAGEHGPLGRFLTNLKAELCQSVGIPEERLSVLGVRGEYMKFSMLEVKEGRDARLQLLGTHTSGTRRNDPHAHSPQTDEGNDSSSSGVGMRDLAAEAAAAAAVASSVVKGSAGSVTTEGRRATDSEDTESIVDLEILPGASASEPSPHTVFLVMQRQLSTPDSRIMSGPFMELLSSASLALPARPANTTNSAESDRSGAVRGGLEVAVVMLVYTACSLYSF